MVLYTADKSWQLVRHLVGLYNKSVTTWIYGFEILKQN